jgi:glutamyl-tRNA reductase
LGEVMILSTCNRVEVYSTAESAEEARLNGLGALSSQRGVELSSLEPFLYTKVGAEAIRHAFRVASSLDSMILGEPQILGQVKDAFQVAQDCQTTGPILHAVMTQAFSVAKKVRTETGVARHAVSVSVAAVELARKIFGGLRGKAVLLVGAGKMGEQAARRLVDHGAFPIYVTNRTWARAQEISRALHGQAVRFEDFPTVLPEVDIVITSTGAPDPIVSVKSVQAALHARRSRPIFFIDIAVPRDVEARVNDLPNVFCYDIDDLRQVVDANIRERLREAEKAEVLVEREVERFTARLKDLEVVPTIVSLRAKLESIRQLEVGKTLSRVPDASEEVRAAIEAMSNAIVNKILHAPIVKLRESSRSGHGRSWVEAVQELFGLAPKEPKDD